MLRHRMGDFSSCPCGSFINFSRIACTLCSSRVPVAQQDHHGSSRSGDLRMIRETMLEQTIPSAQQDRALTESVPQRTLGIVDAFANGGFTLRGQTEIRASSRASTAVPTDRPSDITLRSIEHFYGVRNEWTRVRTASARNAWGRPCRHLTRDRR